MTDGENETIVEMDNIKEENKLVEKVIEEKKKPSVIALILLITSILILGIILFSLPSPEQRQENDYSGLFEMKSIKIVCDLNDTISIDYCNQLINWRSLIHIYVVKSFGTTFDKEFVMLMIKTGELNILSSYKQAKKFDTIAKTIRYMNYRLKKNNAIYTYSSGDTTSAPPTLH